MPQAARRLDPTAHGKPLGPGPGSRNVRIGKLNAWRALPAGPVGAAVESAARAVQSLMSTPMLTPIAAAGPLAETQANLQHAAGAAAAQGNGAALSAAATGCAALTAANTALSATWAAASAAPGGLPGATIAYSEGLKAVLASAASAVFGAVAGAADMHQCPCPCPTPPHGPGVVTRGSRTVRINGLPAARQNDSVVEACGGSDPIVAGCETVNIGG